MLHFSCDLCSSPLDDRRYVVRLEAYPAFDPDALDEADFDLDHLQEVADSLADLPDGLPSDVSNEAARVFRFDLCPACYQKFLRDPLGREALRRLKYSKN
jgi:hypothetical protein